MTEISPGAISAAIAPKVADAINAPIVKAFKKNECFIKSSFLYDVPVDKEKISTLQWYIYSTSSICYYTT